MISIRARLVIVAVLAAVGGAAVASNTTAGLVVAITTGLSLAAVILTTRAVADMGPGDADEQAWMEFRRELRRARRHGRSLTLVRIPSVAGSDVDVAAAAKRAGARLRLVDRAWLDDGSLYLMLPESNRDAAIAAIERIGPEPLLAMADARFAAFPDDGLTSGAIISAVHGAVVDQVPIPIRPKVDDLIAAIDDDRFSAEVSHG